MNRRQPIALSNVRQIRVRTWDTVELPPGTFDDIDLSTLPWVNAKVAVVERGRYSDRIRIGPFAGRIVIPGRLVIDIQELAPGTVANLIGLAHSGIRWKNAPGARGVANMDPWQAILGPYATTLREYATQGPEKRYLERRVDTSFPRGRVNLARTNHHYRARGRRDVISCDTRRLTDDTPFNRLLLAAAVRAERILEDTENAIALRETRQSLLFLQDVLLQPVVDVSAARAAIEPRDLPKLRLFQLAELIVNGVTILPEGLDTSEQPVSAWVNVERIFEEAVLSVCTTLMRPLPVRRGKGDGMRLLAGEYEGDADPDVVIEHGTGTAILDAKYRRHGGSTVERDELYQLMSHAVAYSATRAGLLVQRMEPRETSRVLGVDTRGCTFDLLVVDADRPASIVDELTAWWQSAPDSDERISSDEEHSESNVPAPLP